MGASRSFGARGMTANVRSRVRARAIEMKDPAGSAGRGSLCPDEIVGEPGFPHRTVSEDGNG